MYADARTRIVRMYTDTGMVQMRSNDKGLLMQSFI